MGNIGILELIIILIAGLTLIGAYVLAIKKLFKSKITTYQKIFWAFVIVFFNFVGLVVFFIYHDFNLTPELRGSL
jgi:hypothetical protein